MRSAWLRSIAALGFALAVASPAAAQASAPGPSPGRTAGRARGEAADEAWDGTPEPAVQAAPAWCGLAGLPGLAAARARVPTPAAGPPNVVHSALRAASADEFIQIAAAVTGLIPAAPEIERLLGGGDALVPCTASVSARDRQTYTLLLGGYSAREIADIVSGRLTRRDVDDAQRLLMAGQDESVAAAFLDRALTRRQVGAAKDSRVTARRSPATGRGPSGRRPPAPPESRPSRVTSPSAIVADAAVRDAIARFAGQYQVDPDLVLAMMAAESGGVADAVSPKGAVGLLQLMPATARMLGVDPTDPIENLRGGIAYLAGLLGQFGNTRDALIAYNAGPSHAARVRQGLAVLYGETRRYLEIIGQRYPL